LKAHTGAALCVAFSADGCYLASGSTDETIRLWDVTQGFAEIAATHTSRSLFRPLSFSPTSNCLVSGSNDGTLYFWDIRSGKFEQVGEVINGESGCVYSVAFSPDGLSVASGSEDTSVKIWAVPTTSNQSPAVPKIMGESVTEETYSLDRHGHAVLSDESFIDEDGWMRDSRGKDSRRLFWVPKDRREVFRKPQDDGRIGTRIDFTRFVHGGHWVECRSESEGI